MSVKISRPAAVVAFDNKHYDSEGRIRYFNYIYAHDLSYTYVIICANIQYDRQTLLWWHPTHSCIQGQLPHRDPHSKRS